MNEKQKTIIPSGEKEKKTFSKLMLYAPTPCIFFICVLLIVFSIIAKGFATASNFQAILTQIGYIGIVALGLNFVILLGEIDTAVAIGMVLSAYAFSIITTLTESVLIGLISAIVMGGIYGVINGLLISKLRISSFIATIATKNIFRGLLLVFAGGGAFKLNDPRFSGKFQDVINQLAMGTVNLPKEKRVLAVANIAGINVSILIFIALFIVMIFVAKHTNWGRNVFAVGCNHRAAVVAGINVSGVVVLAYVVCGLCCGLAGAVYMSQVSQLQAASAAGYEMRMIAACAIGGTSMAGGRGSAVSPFVGAVLMGIILNATAVMAVPGTLQDFFLGAIILIAVSMDIIRRKVVDKNHD